MPSIQVEDRDETILNVDSAPPEEPVEQQAIQQPSNTESAKPKKRVKFSIILMILLLLGLSGGLVYLIKDRNELKNEVTELSQSNKTDSSQEAKDLSNEVGKLIELPSDETPTVATVVDVDKVRNQAFFTNAQNGDKVLLYAKASKAILYRPSTKKIIEVAPINIGDSEKKATDNQ